ncbi:MAG: glycosyltransferase family 2 protein [Gemmatimonadota bacterium]|nr:glycosyltransferase family 2 protein [Gemmatimonadota bacterium]
MILSPGMTEFGRDLITTVEAVTIVYMLALNSFYALTIGLSIPELLRDWRIGDDESLRLLRAANVVPPVSVLVPAHNEVQTIVASVRSFLSLEYPIHEVVVVNDGSTDGTMQALIDAYDLYEVPQSYRAVVNSAPVRGYYRSRVHTGLACVDKVNAGKGDSLNAALNAARFPYVLAVDADTLVERDALLRLARPFVLGEDVAAVGGTIRVANGSTIENGRVLVPRVDARWLPGIQTVEYLRAFLFGRLAWNRLGGGLIISGAFGLFKHSHLQAIGGYRVDSVTEDLDVVLRLHEHLRDTGSTDLVLFVPDPVAWTEVPVTLKVLRHQRERWHRGLISTLITHRRVMFNPHFGILGFVAYPFFFFGEMLAPLVELLGYAVFLLSIVFGMFDASYARLYFFAALGYGLITSLWAVLLEELSFRKYKTRRDLRRLIWFAMIEPFGYRQLTVLYRAEAFWSYFRRKKRWGVMTREVNASEGAPDHSAFTGAASSPSLSAKST